MWRNGGPQSGGTGWIWYPVEHPIATGVYYNGYAVRFADLNGDGRAEYLGLGMDHGALQMWYNGCSADEPDPPTLPPATPQDPLHHYGDGRRCRLDVYGRLEDIPLTDMLDSSQAISQVCIIMHSLEMWAKQIRDQLDEYQDIVDNHWDAKFSRYSGWVADMANVTIRDWTSQHGGDWFDCTITERVYCCTACKIVVEPDHPERCRYCVEQGDEGDDECHPDGPGGSDPKHSYRNVSERCPPNYNDRGVGGNGRQSVYWHVQDGKSWEDMAERAEQDVGINATFIVPDTILFHSRTPFEVLGCGHTPWADACIGEDWWYQTPMITHDYSKRDVANPKEFLELAIPAYRKTPQDLDGIAQDLRTNSFRIDGERVDPAEYLWVIAVFASSLNESIVAMREVVRLADEIEEQERKEAIILWLGSIATLLPLIGPYLAPELGLLGRGLLANFLRNVLTAGPVLTNWGLAIYQAVEDPDMIPLLLFNIFIQGGVTVKVNMAQMGFYVRTRDAVIYNTMGGALLWNHKWLY
jgi:hypothetical protein